MGPYIVSILRTLSNGIPLPVFFKIAHIIFEIAQKLHQW